MIYKRLLQKNTSDNMWDKNNQEKVQPLLFENMILMRSNILKYQFVVTGNNDQVVMNSHDLSHDDYMEVTLTNK